MLDSFPPTSDLHRRSKETKKHQTMTLPPGFLFIPRDEELLNTYPRKKILGEPLPCDIIVEADVYGGDPNNLTAHYSMANTDCEWFFFTSTARKQPGASDSSRASRCTGLGRWKATQATKTVLDSNLNVLGSKQSFCYMERRPSGGESKTIWLMEEYSIHSLRGKAGASAISGSNKIYMTPKARKLHATQEDLPEIESVNSTTPEPEAKRRRMEDPQTNNSPFMRPSQDIADHCQILQLPDDTLRPLVDDVSSTPIDGCSSTQHAGGEPSIPSQDIADIFQIHQPADGTLPQSDPTVPMLVEMMEGPQHVSRLSNVDQFPKDIDAEDSSIVFSQEIMQDGGEESDEMAALIGSLCDDISMPSIDDVLR